MEVSLTILYTLYLISFHSWCISHPECRGGVGEC